MNLETEKIELPYSKETIITKLNDIDFFKDSIPEQVSNLKVVENVISFEILGGTKIELHKQTTDTDKVHYKSSGKLDFDIFLNLNAVDTNKTISHIEFKGKFNPMIAMMAKNPLQNFIDQLNNKITELKF